MASSKPPSRSSGYVGVVIDHAAHRSFNQFAQTEAWSPAVNVYQFGHRLEVCVDLAGIDRDKIDVVIKQGRLTISGARHAPEPQPPHEADASASHEPMKILSMEIDYGAFQRVVQVPQQVDLDRVQSEYRQGLLWITLPFK